MPAAQSNAADALKMINAMVPITRFYKGEAERKTQSLDSESSCKCSASSATKNECRRTN